MYVIHLSQFAVGCLAIFAVYLVALIIFLYVRGNIFRLKALNYIGEASVYAEELAEARQANGHHDLGVANRALALKSAVGGAIDNSTLILHDFGGRGDSTMLATGPSNQEHTWLGNQDSPRNEAAAFQSFIESTRGDQQNHQLNDGYDRTIPERVVV